MATLLRPRDTRKRPSKSSDPILKPGTSFCRCAACGEYFRSERAFEAHRVGEYRPVCDRACAPTARMDERGLQRDAKGVWGFPPREFHADRRAELDQRRSPPGYVAMTMHGLRSRASA